MDAFRIHRRAVPRFRWRILGIALIVGPLLGFLIYNLSHMPDRGQGEAGIFAP